MKRYETNINNNTHMKISKVTLVDKPSNLEWNIINIYPTMEKQQWLGLGGSLTESAAFNLLQLSPIKRNQVIKMYFHKNGLNYNFLRLPIGSNDFCLNHYENLETNDISKINFTREEKYLIPILTQIFKINIPQIIASPWSPPEIYKENKYCFNGDKLLKDYYGDYAKYLVHTINYYNNKKIKINYLTIQNEPFAKQRWESCYFTLDEQKEFIYNYLIPELKSSDCQILLWDHNKDNLIKVFKNLYMDNPLIGGVAYHWYTGTHEKNLSTVRKLMPNKLLINTEACCGYSSYSIKEYLSKAEYYLMNILSDIECGSNAFVDWNMILDFNGGPTHANNPCAAPIILDEKGKNYIITPIYQYLKQFSSTIENNSFIIETDVYRKDLFCVSCKNNSEINIIILNIMGYDMEFNLVIENKYFSDKISAHSVLSYTISQSELDFN